MTALLSELITELLSMCLEAGAFNSELHLFIQKLHDSIIVRLLSFLRCRSLSFQLSGKFLDLRLERLDLCVFRFVETGEDCRDRSCGVGNFLGDER